MISALSIITKHIADAGPNDMKIEKVERVLPRTRV